MAINKNIINNKIIKKVRNLFKNRKLLLIIILFIAAFLRFYKLGKIPPALQWDEISMGYESYSILKTGKDQFGNFLPVFFRCLDDWKPGMYMYISVIPIALFGLNAFSVRFGVAFFGVLSVYFTYLLFKEIFKNNKNKEIIALLTSFLLAVSPWHLQVTHALYQVSISIFLLILAVYLFFKGLEKNKYLWFSSFLFGLGFYSYTSARIVLPLMWLSMILIHNHKILFKKKKMLAFFIPFLVLLFLYIPHLNEPGAKIRFEATNILQMEEYADNSILEVLEDKKRGAYLGGRIFHNRRFAFINWENTGEVIRNYFSHFRPEFLFIKADVPLHHAPNMGLLYAVEIPFVVLGFLLFLKNKLNRKTLIILAWFLIAPIPASVTRQVPHTIRTALFLPTFQFFTAFGFIKTFEFIKRERKLFAYLFTGIVIFLLTYNIGYYLHQFYVHLPYEYSQFWKYARKQAVEYTEENKHKYDQVLVSTDLEFPWIFWLFYAKYPPQEYLEDGGTVSGGFAAQENSFDKYDFRKFDYDAEKSQNFLFVGNPKEFPHFADVVKEIEYKNGEKAIIIAK